MRIRPSGDLTSLQHGGSEGAARMRATFDLDETERSAMLENAASGWALQNAGVLSSPQFVYEQLGDQGLRVHELLGSWAGLGVQPLARLHSDPAGNGAAFEIIRAFQPDGGEQAQPSAVTDVREAAPQVRVSAGSQYPSPGLEGFLSAHRVLGPAWALMSGWRDRFYHFRALRTGTLRAQNLSSPENLDPAGTNLAGVLLHSPRWLG